jgi:hypothetical protein
VDAESGKKIWYFHTRNSVVNDIASAEGKILACDTENTLYDMLKRSSWNGSERWAIA